MGNRTRRVGPVDNIWLTMDRPENLMVIEGVMFLEAQPDWDVVLGVLEDRVLAAYPVFTQRRVPSHVPGSLPSWQDDPDFDLQHHIHRTRLPAPGDDAVLQSYIDEHLSRPLDPTRPLWEMHFVDGHAGGSVLFCRFHHAMADGIALTRVLLSLTDDSAAGAPVHTRPAPAGREGERGEHRDAVPGLLLSAAGLAVEGVEQALTLARPSGVMRTIGLGFSTARTVAGLLLTQTPKSELTGTPTGQKRVLWTSAVPLPSLKHLGRLAGATLNDVLLAAVAGALHRYQKEQGSEPRDLVTMVPVNVRPLDEPLPPELGNRFTLVLFSFPSGTAGALARLAETHRRMDRIKTSPQALVTYGLIHGIGAVPSPVQRPAVDFFADKAIGVTTNVMGPQTPRTMAGVPVTGVLGWVPGSGRHSLGVCIFTYDGTVRIGLLADTGVVAEPDLLLRWLEEELATFVALAGRT